MSDLPLRVELCTSHYSACPCREWRFKQLEAENAKLRKAEWYTWDQVSREIHDGDIWWHDNGDQIFPVNIMWCPTGNYFFASLGQWGWTRSQKLEEMGGVWTPCVEPERLKGGE